eukprot:GHVR01190666.1.p1 GENE.GHVR01190666.1~~GHVR01190666.1.p1  ORF type:complete len:193 (+),score=41.66 GHVR01190666.1:22-600(+)
MNKMHQALNEHIDMSSVECLGEDPINTLSNALLFKHKDNNKDTSNSTSNSNIKILSSHDDPQLLLKISFRSPVKLSGIRFIYYNSSSNNDDDNGTLGCAPRNVKLFTNKMSMGFSDAESDSCLQQFELTEQILQEQQIVPLRLVKFQNISSIQAFIEDNHGGEVTMISRVELFGTPSDSMNMKDWAPTKEDQ